MKEDFTITDRVSLEHAFKSINSYKQSSNKILLLSVKPYKKPRTLKQNSTLHYCCNELRKAFQETGRILTNTQTKEFIKKSMGFIVIIEGKEIARSSADATTEEVNEMIAWAQAFSLETLEYPIVINEDAI